ncbi:MAG: hypothetical protein PHX61_08225 [Alphaproteobacteria bacterium]|nr:hypothetical protein [Alphaproteobacteria bacterium]
MDHKTAIRYFWKDLFAVTIHAKTTDPSTKITGFSDSVKYQDQPGKLSFETLTSTDQGDTSAVTQSVKLFCDPALEIPAGSKISITHAGRTVDYSRSGEPGIYTDHQEIPLELFRGWA